MSGHPVHAPVAWSRFTLIIAAVFLVSLDATAMVAAFPALRAHFPATAPATLSWVLNAYTLVYAALLAPFGGWTDRHGHKRAFRLGLTLFTAASIACSVAGQPGFLIVARIAQAVGAALLTPASLALALTCFPLEKRAVAVSLWGAVGALAAAIGPTLGSWLIDVFSWQAIFWVNVPLGLFIWQRSATRLAESVVTRAHRRTDWFGALLLSVGSGLLILGLVRTDTEGWLAWSTGLTIAAGILLISTFVGWARGRADAAVDLGLFRDVNYRFANLATLLFGACFGLMFLSFYLFMTSVWHYSQSRAGLAALAGPLLVIPFAMLGGKIAARQGHRVLLVSGGLLYALGQLWYYFRITTEPAYLTAWLPGQLVSGAAIGLVLPSLAGAAVARLPANALASGNAVNQAVRQLGMAFGIAIAVACVGHTSASLADFLSVYLMLAGGGIGTALLALPINTRPGFQSSDGVFPYARSTLATRT